MSRRTLTTLLIAAGFAIGSLAGLPRARRVAVAPTFTVAHAQLPLALDDSTFVRLIRRISEPGGYFDTDNLISNEASYLHVIGKLQDLKINGGAYIGVGPDQNFSYIAAIRPNIAFIIDIRRDNLLQHLWFKSLFHSASTRIEYLALMFGRSPPPDAQSWRTRSIGELIEFIDEAPPDTARFAATHRSLMEAIAAFGLALSEPDREHIRAIHRTFHDSGLDLRYSSHGRPPRASYPTYRQLLLESDRQHRQANYLASEESYQWLRAMQLRNLIIPVTGDFAGLHALREIGNVLRERGERVKTFYASNVEFYLMQDRTFPRFAENLISLPLDRDGVIIRSLFGRIYGHPQAVPGYNSTQLLQKLDSFVDEYQKGAYASYGDLVYRTFVDLRD